MRNPKSRRKRRNVPMFKSQKRKRNSRHFSLSIPQASQKQEIILSLTLHIKFCKKYAHFSKKFDLNPRVWTLKEIAN
jgi:Holliday junction resolvase RusA-like endonuclease